MIESAFQNLSTVQSNQQPSPVTIASASVIAPTSFLTIITGTTQLVTITPPVSGVHMLAFHFTSNMGAFSTGGNILTAADPTQDCIMFMTYNPVSGKYIPGPVA
jgi:hypothetical protein